MEPARERERERLSSNVLWKHITKDIICGSACASASSMQQLCTVVPWYPGTGIVLCKVHDEHPVLSIQAKSLRRCAYADFLGGTGAGAGITFHAHTTSVCAVGFGGGKVACPSTQPICVGFIEGKTWGQCCK